MPRKVSEIDVIDGVIFQSFETPEGMQGCFQYTVRDLLLQAFIGVHMVKILNSCVHSKKVIACREIPVRN